MAVLSTVLRTLTLLVLLATTAGAQSRDRLYASSWALVIGVNAYQHVSPRLNYAVADAQAVAAALPGLGFPRQNIRVLLDGEATKASIEQVLHREFSKMSDQDRLFVFFAGHGETERTKSGDEGYLLPVDADPSALPLTAIPMDELRRIGNRVRAKHVLFVMDACFSGFAITRDVVPRATTDEYLSAALREPVVQVLTAGRKGERAIEEGSHGLFTRRFLDGLRGLADPEGRGVITVGQLAAWIEPRVVRDSGGRMTPQYGKLDGEGQFVFVIPAPPPAPPAVVPQVAAIASHGLLALYKADGGADDCIGGRHGALRNGAAFGPGRFGQAFRLDGVSGYVEVPADRQPGPPPAGDFTVSLWVNDDGQDGYREFISKGLVSRVGGNAFYIGTSAAGDLRVGDSWLSTGVSSLRGTGWHHYAVVRTASDTLPYVDGVVRAQRGYAIPNPPATAPLRIGRQFGDYGEQLSGLVDEVAIFGRALSAAEIATLTKSELPCPRG